MEIIYLDHSATTPVDPEVLGAMMRFFANRFGNPSSSHGPGRQARSAVEEARQSVSSLIGAQSDEIVFTSGGTEADNLAILGSAAAAQGKDHVVTTAVEHHAVLYACRHLESRGFRATYIPVDGRGLVSPEDIRHAITDRTFLISVMHANNEIGTVQPLAEISAIARERGIPVHTDAVQSVGKVPVGVNDLGVDLLTIAAHKFHGPKGIGALYVRRGTPIRPIVFGGHQEGGLRNGTENVPGIVGLGKACEVAGRILPAQMDLLNTLRETLRERICRDVEGASVNGHPFRRLPHILSVSFPGIAADALVRELDRAGIAVSAGSACTSDQISLSHVLEALGVPREIAMGTIRFSFGKGNTADETDHAANIVPAVVGKLRHQSEIEASLGGRGCH